MCSAGGEVIPPTLSSSYIPRPWPHSPHIPLPLWGAYSKMGLFEEPFRRGRWWVRSILGADTSTPAGWERSAWLPRLPSSVFPRIQKTLLELLFHTPEKTLELLLFQTPEFRLPDIVWNKSRKTKPRDIFTFCLFLVRGMYVLFEFEHMWVSPRYIWNPVETLLNGLTFSNVCSV